MTAPLRFAALRGSSAFQRLCAFHPDLAQRGGPLSSLGPPMPAMHSLGKLPPYKALSDRQAACLYWAAAGKTSWETSRILDVAESTVNFHLRNACTKLGVRGRRTAVVVALRHGLLDSVIE
ncbi:helix-turn-helix transcriptional regulator [Achromobacter sp. LC458]|uniref:LuxR family transcriptional regulator n=2 Tax=Achromobacter TaxID=222 RepID=A0A2S5GNE3_9BURK|nr:MULTISPECIES: helix-turn-helix transcriptional regulator [unclassified Achromobacter]PPA74363.1 LuxR family transcriptional regulator [Achromobacter spanius]HCQ49784.1 LuxR family transcriptional regulator [Achromobacter sp.]AYD67433.1 LuxR family transcriptional regulator [Achromobacter sp. B7]QYJ22067.1 helix-turn-helix transcriptional regulator [Achromobacter sp. ES-001]TRM50733.1 helix-turn-helix transcriptional regulator [Achromobacter sp. LC458]